MILWLAKIKSEFHNFSHRVRSHQRPNSSTNDIIRLFHCLRSFHSIRLLSCIWSERCSAPYVCNQTEAHNTCGSMTDWQNKPLTFIHPRPQHNRHVHRNSFDWLEWREKILVFSLSREIFNVTTHWSLWPVRCSNCDDTVSLCFVSIFSIVPRTEAESRYVSVMNTTAR